MVLTSPESRSSNIYKSFILPISSCKSKGQSLKGCNEDLTLTSPHTSVRTAAVKSLNSLWWRVGNPPLGQFMAWSTLKPWLQTQLVTNQEGANHNVNTRHLYKRPCVKQIHAPPRTRQDAPFSLAKERVRCKFADKLMKDIVNLERIQCRATKHILNIVTKIFNLIWSSFLSCTYSNCWTYCLLSSH